MICLNKTKQKLKKNKVLTSDQYAGNCFPSKLIKLHKLHNFQTTHGASITLYNQSTGHKLVK